MHALVTSLYDWPDAHWPRVFEHLLVKIACVLAFTGFATSLTHSLQINLLLTALCCSVCTCFGRQRADADAVTSHSRTHSYEKVYLTDYLVDPINYQPLSTPRLSRWPLDGHFFSPNFFCPTIDCCSCCYKYLLPCLVRQVKQPESAGGPLLIALERRMIDDLLLLVGWGGGTRVYSPSDELANFV